MSDQIRIFAITPLEYGMPVCSYAMRSIAASGNAAQRLISLRQENPTWEFFAYSPLHDHDAIGRHPSLNNRRAPAGEHAHAGRDREKPKHQTRVFKRQPKPSHDPEEDEKTRQQDL